MEKNILSTLQQKVNPRHAALMVIDVQNDFCAQGGAFSKAGYDLSEVRDMVTRLAGFIEKARDVNVPVIFVRATYDKSYLSDVWLEQFRRRGTNERRPPFHWDIPLCTSESWGWEFYQVRPHDKELAITKHRYSAFIDTDLIVILRSRGTRTLIVTGVATNVCVESTVRDGFMLDYYVVLVKDCVGAASKKLDEATLENVNRFFGQVVTSEEVVRCWDAIASK